MKKIIANIKHLLPNYNEIIKNNYILVDLSNDNYLILGNITLLHNKHISIKAFEQTTNNEIYEYKNYYQLLKNPNNICYKNYEILNNKEILDFLNIYYSK